MHLKQMEQSGSPKTTYHKNLKIMLNDYVYFPIKTIFKELLEKTK